MKLNEYKVWFANENYEPQVVKLVAGSQQTALILAQANRIKAGLDYTLHKIEEVD